MLATCVCVCPGVLTRAEIPSTPELGSPLGGATVPVMVISSPMSSDTADPKRMAGRTWA